MYFCHNKTIPSPNFVWQNLRFYPEMASILWGFLTSFDIWRNKLLLLLIFVNHANVEQQSQFYKNASNFFTFLYILCSVQFKKVIYCLSTYLHANKGRTMTIIFIILILIVQQFIQLSRGEICLLASELQS